MKENYINPKAEIITFDTKDIITTSGMLDFFKAETANQDSGWTSFY